MRFTRPLPGRLAGSHPPGVPDRLPGLTPGRCHSRRPKLVRCTLPGLLIGTLLTGACTVSRQAPDPAVSQTPVPAAARAPSLPATPTLYEALGGADGVEALTADFLRELAADDTLRQRFRDTNIARLHRLLQEQMCAQADGGCRYTGDDMRRAHGGLDITPAEFNGLVEALMRAMDRNRLPQGVQNRLLARYAPMRRDIVER